MKIKSKILLAALLFSANVNSATITWSYTGTITGMQTGFSDLYAIGDSFSGFFSYDTSTQADSILPSPASNGELAQYEGGLVSGGISIGDFSMSYQNRDTTVTLLNDFTDLSTQEFHGDALVSAVRFNEINDLDTSYLSIGLADSTGSIFNSSSFPDANIDVSFLDSMSLIVSNTSGTCEPASNICDLVFTMPLEGVIDSVTVSSVPVPAAVWLFLSGLLGMAGIGYRSNVS